MTTEMITLIVTIAVQVIGALSIVWKGQVNTAVQGEKISNLEKTISAVKNSAETDLRQLRVEIDKALAEIHRTQNEKSDAVAQLSKDLQDLRIQLAGHKL